MQVRRLIRVLHRDVGYFVCVLVILYSISGIAVNHIDQWNPNRYTTVEDVDIGPLEGTTLFALQGDVVDRLGLDPEDVQGHLRKGPAEFVVFLLHGNKVTLDPATGKGTLTRVLERPFLFQANILHLNDLKGVWTWVADAFSVLLFGLAVSGLFMLKGEKGLGGRGKWIVAAGALVPVGFLITYYATR